MGQKARESNWGRWGPADERGALNLLTRDSVHRAAGIVQRGEVYGLGVPIDASGAPILQNKGEPRRFTLTSDSDEEMYRGFGAAPGVGGNQDMLMIPSHHGTHIDALAHVFADRRMYNGFPSSTFTSFSGASRLGIEKMGPIVGRAVLLDVAKYEGVDVLPPGHHVTASDLESCAAHQGIEMRSGDILLLRTGWIEAWAATGRMGQGQPGLDLDAVNFIKRHDVAVVGADNSAVEVIPFDREIFLAVHTELLVQLGVPLIEHLNLGHLARDQVYESLFFASPLLVTGAAGSPINPVAVA